MLYSTHQLDTEQLQHLERLKQHCQQHDSGSPNLYLHILTQYRAFPSTLLYYDQQELVGFLSVYFFYNDAVEVSLLIHPAYRHKGLATMLVKSILPLINKQGYNRLIFSSPIHLNDSWLQAHHYTYLHSEYHMERTARNPILEPHKTLSYRHAIIDDVPALCELDKQCFPQRQEDLVTHMQHVIDSREYLIILALYHDVLIGKAHIRWQQQRATLSDIAITPRQQGKGFGAMLIAHCVNFALSEGKSRIDLDVETHNKRALNLYTRLDFSIENACDFWSINSTQLDI